MLVHNAPYPDPIPFRSADSDLGKTSSVPVLRSNSTLGNELIVTNKEECKYCVCYRQICVTKADKFCVLFYLFINIYSFSD
jgi:hypothetical protein